MILLGQTFHRRVVLGNSLKRETCGYLPTSHDRPTFLLRLFLFFFFFFQSSLDDNDELRARNLTPIPHLPMSFKVAGMYIRLP